jgi:hypothetical protein
LVAEAVEVEDAALLVLYQEGIERNKRCMLAYLYVCALLYCDIEYEFSSVHLTDRRARLDLIERLRWEVGIVTQEHKEKMSPFELQYFDEYNSLLAKYMQSTGVDVVSAVCSSFYDSFFFYFFIYFLIFCLFLFNGLVIFL